MNVFIAALDFRVSPDADQRKRFGPSLLYRYFPFWITVILDRAIIVLLPLVVVVVPVMSLLPQFLRWRMRSRIFRWYRELAYSRPQARQPCQKEKTNAKISLRGRRRLCATRRARGDGIVLSRCHI